MDELSLASSSVDELRSSARSLEQQLVMVRFRQLQVFAELHERGYDAMGLRGLPDLIQADLNCTRRTARSLSVEVERFVGRNAVSGEPLAPVYPVTANALATGSMGFEHAKVIGDVVEQLSAEVRAERAETIERTLVGQSTELDPSALKKLAERIVAYLDPDGPEPKQEQQYRQRRVELGQRCDGTGVLEGALTPECAAIWQAVLTPLAAQRPPGDLGQDTRTRWQRMHDAFEQAGRLLLESGRLPDHAGLPAQLLITIELTDLESRIGRATTQHGGTLTVRQALRLAAEANLIPVVLDQELGLDSHGRGRRLASPHQRKVLFARDRGCTFPGCTFPGCTKTAAESEIHHIRDWVSGGPTDLGNLTITCGYHNNEAPKQGWRTESINGIPHWTPPRWRDPARQPRRNYVHHPELLLRT